MAIDFAALLPAEEKKAMLENQIHQLIYAGYQHTLNRQIAQALESEEGIELADQYLAQTEAQLQVHQEALDALLETAVD